MRRRGEVLHPQKKVGLCHCPADGTRNAIGISQQCRETTMPGERLDMTGVHATVHHPLNRAAAP